MEQLTQNQVFSINCRLAKEFIEERLDAAVTEDNIHWLVTCIQKIEASIN